MNILEDDLDAFFNLHLVDNNIRRGYLLEMNNDTREKYSHKFYLNIIHREFPHLFIQKHDKNRYLISKEKIPLPKDDKELAEILDFDCKGIIKGNVFYVLRYYVEDVEFYAATCPEKRFIKGDVRYKKFKNFGSKLGLDVKMEIEEVVNLNTETFLTNIHYWLDNEEDFFNQLNGHGLGYLGKYHLRDIINRNMPLMLFTLLRIDRDPLRHYYPLSTNIAKKLEDYENKIFTITSEPISTFEKLEKNFIHKNLDINNEYLNIKNCLFKEYYSYI